MDPSLWQCPSLCINCDQFTITQNKDIVLIQCWLPPLTIQVEVEKAGHSEDKMADLVQRACVAMKIIVKRCKYDL